MKTITAVFNVSIEDAVLAALRSVGVEHFTQWPRIVGVGPRTGPRMDSHVWPGANSSIVVLVDDATAVCVLSVLQELHDSPEGQQAGLTAWQTNVEQMLH